MPHLYNKGKVQGHKLKIQEILSSLNALSSSVNEHPPHLAPVHPYTATASASESGTSLSLSLPISCEVSIAP